MNITQKVEIINKLVATRTDNPNKFYDTARVIAVQMHTSTQEIIDLYNDFLDDEYDEDDVSYDGECYFG